MGIITPIIVVVVILCALGFCKKIRDDRKSDYLEEERVSRDFVSGNFETRDHHREPGSRGHQRQTEARVHHRASESKEDYNAELEPRTSAEFTKEEKRIVDKWNKRKYS